MRRDRIIEAVESLREALSAAQVRQVLNFLRHERATDATLSVQRILACYSAFSQYYVEFGDEERDLMQVFGLVPLSDVNFWSSLIDADSQTVNKAIGTIDVGLYNVLFVLPKLKHLLARQNETESMFVTSSDGSQRAVKRLRMMVSENSSGLTQTVVLTNVLKAVEDFYEVLFPLHKTSYVPLSVGGVDSGDVKVVDFFGVDDVVTDMTEVLADVWHRVKYSMIDNFRYEIQVSVSCIEFYGRLEAAKRSKLLSQEDVQRIVQTIAKSVEVIFRSGAYTDEMNQVDDMRASSVLRRRTEVMEQQSQQATAQTEAQGDNVEMFRGPAAVKQRRAGANAGNGAQNHKPRAH